MGLFPREILEAIQWGEGNGWGGEGEGAGRTPRRDVKGKGSLGKVCS